MNVLLNTALVRACKRLVLTLTVTAAGAFHCASAASDGGRVTSDRNEEALLKYIRPALASVGGAARLYYTTDCHAKDGYPIPFPRIEAETAAKGKMGFPAVRSVFDNNKQARVTQDQSGIIRIKIGHPDAEILRTRIHSVTLSPIERFNAYQAIGAILQAKEIKAAMTQLGLGYPVVIVGMNVVTPERGRPHLPKTINDMTMDEAFDLIAKKFGGIASYGTCQSSSGEKLFYVNFFDVIVWEPTLTTSTE